MCSLQECIAFCTGFEARGLLTQAYGIGRQTLAERTRPTYAVALLSHDKCPRRGCGIDEIEPVRPGGKGRATGATAPSSQSCVSARASQEAFMRLNCLRVASSEALSSNVKQRPAFSRRCSDWLDWLSALLAG
ncbi:hypothetical protein XI06_09910 [Bradyrhizobium sp. CCBAU 11434]|nr:hypothetical protein [Bradyrhizobium sp. CCBAU 11434]